MPIIFQGQQCTYFSLISSIRCQQWCWLFWVGSMCSANWKRYWAYGRSRWHHCHSTDILLFVLQDGARGEEGSHMAGIYQPMAARVIKCELKVKLQTAERERESRAWCLGSGTRLFIISLKGRSTVQWITLTTKLTACSLSALLHFPPVLNV